MNVDYQSNDQPRGQGLVEYVLILILVAVICVAAFSYFGEQTANKMPELNVLEDE